MKLGNPALNRLEKYTDGFDSAVPRATYSGIAIKATLFLVLTLASSIVTYVLCLTSFTNAEFIEKMLMFIVIAPIGALVFALIAAFAPKTIPITGSIYVILQGVSIGFISCIIESAYSGIVFAAILATCIVFGVMLALYSFKVIRVSNGFVRFIANVLISTILINLAIYVLSLFIPNGAQIFYGNGVLSIIISVVMVIIASFTLLADFKICSNIVESGLSKQYEWRASFGLIVTLIWLYIEILELLMKIASRAKN